jgi:hypothetical protein
MKSYFSGRHKWNGRVGNSIDDLVVACVYCGCVKQTVKGYPTYFINDIVYDKIAPKCAGQITINERMDAINKVTPKGGKE